MLFSATWGCAPGLAAPPHRTGPPSPPRWGSFDAARAWPRAGPVRTSRGHGVDGTWVDVRVSPDSLRAYERLVPGGTLPVGTIAVAFHRSQRLEPSGGPGPVGEGDPSVPSIYVMTKRADRGWEYAVMESDGQVVASGALPLCAACHDEAPADHVFGVPRPALPRGGEPAPAPPVPPGN